MAKRTRGSRDPNDPLDRSGVLRFMRKALAGYLDAGAHTYSELMSATLREFARADLVDRSFDRLDAFHQLAGNQPVSPLAIALTEAYGFLLTLGYIVPRPDPPQSPNRDLFLVTENGRAWIAGSEPVPEDLEGFRQGLGALVSNLDPVIDQYVHEALIAYDRQAFFAAAVMIGAASEKAVYLLMDALLAAVTDAATRKAINDVIERRRLLTMLELLRKELAHARKSGAMPFSVHEGADAHLLSLQEAIRLQRNEAVHPQAGRVTPVGVRLALSAFPAACRKTYDLINWLQANKLPKR